MNRGPFGTALSVAAALALAVAGLAFAAAKSPSLRIGPVTAIIVILARGGHDAPIYAAQRMAEIMLGSCVGVAATLFVFPARARQVAIARAGALLAQLDEVFGVYVEALARGAPIAETAELNARIRVSLTALETVVGEVAHEARAHLGSAYLPEGLVRTLWRVRNDSIVIGRTLSRAFTPVIAGRLSAPAQALLEAARLQLRACAAALAAGAKVEPSPVPAAMAAFHEAFQGLRDDGVMRGLEFEEIGHVFGLAWAFDNMERNLADLTDRVDETASGHRTGKPVVAA